MPEIIKFTSEFEDPKDVNAHALPQPLHLPGVRLGNVKQVLGAVEGQEALDRLATSERSQLTGLRRLGLIIVRD